MQGKSNSINSTVRPPLPSPIAIVLSVGSRGFSNPMKSKGKEEIFFAFGPKQAKPGHT
jgi:hypothetical protein